MRSSHIKSIGNLHQMGAVTSRSEARSETSYMRSIWLFAAVAFLQIQQGHGEDFGQAFSHTHNTQKSDETYIIICFSAFLAFCILSVITTIAYFSVLEDRLMKRYLDEGEVVEAVVVSSEFARGGGNKWGTSSSSSNKAADRKSTEYVLFVEYSKPIAEGSYMTKVRKQVKAKEEDISRPPHYDSYSSDINEEGLPLGDGPIEVQRMLRMLHDDANAVKIDGLGRIEMLVMPNFHKSGISKRQVERSNSYRHRLSTLALILSGVGLAAFCVRLAAKAISNSEISLGDQVNNDTNQLTLYISAIFAVLLLLEVLLVHCCLNKTFVDALEEEYLKSGDLIPTDEDDSSLSTGSDFFLGKTRREKMRMLGIPQNEPPTQQPIPSFITPPASWKIPSTVIL